MSDPIPTPSNPSGPVNRSQRRPRREWRPSPPESPSLRPPERTPRRRTWEMLESIHPGDWASRVVGWLVLTLIVLNVLAIVLESMESFDARWHGALVWFEQFSVAVFTAEYLGRLWSCVSDARFRGTVRGRLRFALTPMALVDLLAILPAYLPVLGVDLRVVRSLRLLRLFRLLKAGRYSRAAPLIGRVVWSRRGELAVCAALMGVLLFVAATLLYYFEHDAQPDRFSSIPASVWWAIATLTTVGYGDVVPVTLCGRITCGLVAILGITFFALPTSVLGAGFLEELKRPPEPARPSRCPRCGCRHDGTDA